MSNYTPTTDFSAKDALLTGDPAKKVKGSEITTELVAIASAVSSKFDTSTDGAGSGLDADLLDGQQGSHYLDLGNATGTLANARVVAGNVTQHQAALAIAYSQLTAVPSTFTPEAHTHAITALSSVAQDKVLGRYSSGTGVAEEIACTAAGRALIDDATAGDQRTTLGLGDAATKSVGTTAGTVAAGDHAHTYTNSFAADGYSVLPNGLTLMWGDVTASSVTIGAGYSVSFPATFATGCLQIFATLTGDVISGDSNDELVWATPTSTSAFNLYCAGDFSSATIKWFAIGY